MFILLFLATATLTLAAQDEEAVLAAAADAREASRTCDVARLDRILRDDFIAIDPSGRLRTKTEYLDMIRSLAPELKAANAELPVSRREVTVRIYGPAAVMTELRSVQNGASEARYTQVWVKDQDGWRLSTFHGTQVAAPVRSKAAAPPRPEQPR